MSREKVLSFLRSGETVSGEELSRALGLSRTAVWKAVQSLRREGYVIEARPGLGYHLTRIPDALTEREIRNFLGPVRTVGRAVVCFDEIDSTNNYAKKLGNEGGQSGTVVIANCQTAGRGRVNRTFQSPRDKGIYLSVMLRPHLPTKRLLPATALAGVAVCDAVERVCGVRPRLKWPNDPVLGGRKLCGILTEASLEGESGSVPMLVVGIGLNVSQAPEDFTPDVAKIATSLAQELDRPVSRPQLAAAMIEALDRACSALLDQRIGPYLDTFRRDCVNLGCEVQLIHQGKAEVVTALDIDDQFHLLVRDAAGQERTVWSGEVSVRGLDGYTDGDGI